MLLLVTSAAALLLLNLTAPSSGVVQPVERSASASSLVVAPTIAMTTSRLSAGDTPLPSQLDRPMLELTDKDPFVPEVPKPVAIKPPPAPPIMPAQVAAVAPTQPEPPPLNMVYAGRMTTPEGKEVVYMAMGDASVAIEKGMELPNGYRVTSITERQVEFFYPPLNRTQRIDLPTPNKYETR